MSLGVPQKKEPGQFQKMAENPWPGPEFHRSGSGRPSCGLGCNGGAANAQETQAQDH